MEIGIVGYGVVGRAAVEGFRNKGFKVYVNDVRGNLDTYNVCDKKTMVRTCDAIFVCVGTPMGKHGEIDLYQVNEAVDKLVFFAGNSHIEKKPVIIIKSTVVPGTTHRYVELYPHIKFGCNPEFMRQEHAEKDFLDPDRIVVGTESTRAKEVLTEIYAPWMRTPKLWTDFKTAELIKYLSNSFLVAKVAFACEMQKISKLIGCDPEVVMNGVVYDRRINKSHLNPLLGPISQNSPCLPKDLMALIQFLSNVGYESEMLNVILDNGVKKNE